MVSILDSITSLISSIFTGIMSIFTGILALFQHAFNIIFGIIGSLFAAVGTAVSGLAQTFEGLLKFLFSRFALAKAFPTQVENRKLLTAFAQIGNIVVIGMLLGAVFLYTIFVRPGASRTSTKKVN